MYRFSSMQQHVSIVHVSNGTPIKSGVNADVLHETMDLQISNQLDPESDGFLILAHTSKVVVVLTGQKHRPQEDTPYSGCGR
jgi:hypothetical protein